MALQDWSFIAIIVGLGLATVGGLVLYLRENKRQQVLGSVLVGIGVVVLIISAILDFQTFFVLGLVLTVMLSATALMYRHGILPNFDKRTDTEDERSQDD